MYGGPSGTVGLFHFSFLEDDWERVALHNGAERGPVDRDCARRTKSKHSTSSIRDLRVAQAGLFFGCRSLSLHVTSIVYALVIISPQTLCVIFLCKIRYSGTLLIRTPQKVSWLVGYPDLRGWKYTNVVFGTVECVLYIEVSLLQSVLIEGFHCA